MKKESKPQAHDKNNPIIPSNKVINALYTCSYYGKDLLEASGKHNKASILLRDKIDELCNIFTWPAWLNAETSCYYTSIGDMIESFAKFVYSDDIQIKYFVESFMRRFEERLKGELEMQSVLLK